MKGMLYGSATAGTHAQPRGVTLRIIGPSSRDDNGVFVSGPTEEVVVPPNHISASYSSLKKVQGDYGRYKDVERDRHYTFYKTDVEDLPFFKVHDPDYRIYLIDPVDEDDTILWLVTDALASDNAINLACRLQYFDQNSAFADDDLSRWVRSYVAAGTGLPPTRVVPHMSSGSEPEMPFATVTLLRDDTIGWMTDSSAGRSKTRRYAMPIYSVQIVGARAGELAGYFETWRRSLTGTSMAQANKCTVNSESGIKHFTDRNREVPVQRAQIDLAIRIMRDIPVQTYPLAEKVDVTLNNKQLTVG